MTADFTLDDGVAEHYTEAARREIANLQTALESSRTIGVAIGLLMARFRLTEEQAFRYLARCSQQENVKVRALAEQAVRDADSIYSQVSGGEAEAHRSAIQVHAAAADMQDRAGQPDGAESAGVDVDLVTVRYPLGPKGSDSVPSV
jgi:hypothetical protein